MRSITSDMTRLDLRPYFFWDEDISIGEFVAVVEVGQEHPDYVRLVSKMLREARDTDVWSFLRPSDVATLLPRVSDRLGRRTDFWTFLINGWREDGLLAA